MPVVFVFDTHKRPARSVRAMLQSVNVAIAEAVGCPQSSVWIRYQPGAPEDYWEGESGAPEGEQVFAVVQLVEGRKIHPLFGAVSGAIGKAFKIDPQYVWTRIVEFPLDHVGQGDKSYQELRS